MAIGKLSESEFVSLLEGHLRPSRPIDTTELLFGREAAMERMQEAFSSMGRQVVIVDEFDQIEGSRDKELFAQLIKQLGDQEVDACFIFVGIGRSLDALLRGHESCYRYIESVMLDRLHISGRWDIIDKCAAALGVTVNEDSRFRIALISDGFPHYVHLVGQKVFWAAYRDESIVTVIEPSHYQEAVRNALTSVEAHLKQPYEIATKKYKDEYEEVLWAVADHYELLRNTESIYGSYRRVMELRDK